MNKEIENEITREVREVLQKRTFTSDEELREFIKNKVRNRNYLKEDWQIHYSVERIKEKIANSLLSAEENNEKENISQYKGLGGWLILVIIGLFSIVVMEIYNFFDSIALFKDDVARAFIDYSSVFSNLFKIEIVVGILFLIYAINLIFLFFQKSKKFPKYYIILLVASVVWAILDCIILYFLPIDSNEVRQIINETLSEEIPEIGRGIITMVVWGLYMIKSKRVRATFVENN